MNLRKTIRCKGRKQPEEGDTLAKHSSLSRNTRFQLSSSCAGHLALARHVIERFLAQQRWALQRWGSWPAPVGTGSLCGVVAFRPLPSHVRPPWLSSSYSLPSRCPRKRSWARAHPAG